ncbi:hypothetical protein Ddc_18755 [Ditylenchus destructor]|nr:hypothetical protein Ddc_18755 [Ditylenchus destructor]
MGLFFSCVYSTEDLAWACKTKMILDCLDGCNYKDLTKNFGALNTEHANTTQIENFCKTSKELIGCIKETCWIGPYTTNGTANHSHAFLLNEDTFDLLCPRPEDFLDFLRCVDKMEKEASCGPLPKVNLDDNFGNTCSEFTKTHECRKRKMIEMCGTNTQRLMSRVNVLKIKRAHLLTRTSPSQQCQEYYDLIGN